MESLQVLQRATHFNSICPYEFGLSFGFTAKRGELSMMNFFFSHPLFSQIPQKLFEEAFLTLFSAPSLDGALEFIENPSFQRLSPSCLSRALLASAFHIDTRGLEALYSHPRFSEIPFKGKIPSLAIFILTRSVDGLSINKTF